MSVKDTIRQALHEMAEDWALNGEWRMDIDEAVLWLDAQPDAPAQRYEPVETGFTWRGENVSLMVVDNMLGYPPKLFLFGPNFRETIELPDGQAFCKLVEVTE